MQNIVENILKKITYIEAEMEIQKQILHSLPSDNVEDMKEVIQKIAKAKEEIATLRNQLEQESPDEFHKLHAIEQAVASFNQLAETTKFIQVESVTTNPACSVTDRQGNSYDCLVKACDESGNWVIITQEGKIRHFPADEIAVAP